MNNKLATALAGGAVLALALTGCGDDGNKELESWSKKVCDRVQPQVKKIEDANDSIDQASKGDTSSKDVKETDSKAFSDISDAYGSLSKAVDNAGAPPVDDGEKLQKDAVKELNALSTQYGDLKKRVDKLETKDQGKFAEGLKGIASELEKLGKSGDKSLSKLQSGEVGEAMGKQKGCQRAPGGEDTSS
ncbi:small secreted protein [Streptomyces sp. NPDC005438]|uniref:small secreted protein n=1 Tax=Streptomyces sp. NPDC005438 TaxID=3156880 RepID=UPI0033AD19B9